MIRKTFQLIILLCLLLITLPLQGKNTSQRVSLFEEYSLKAAFTLNFARLTRWPETNKENLSMCIMGNNTMQNAFRIVQDQFINDKLSQLKVINRDREIKDCQVLFITDMSHNRLRKIYSSARNHAILTISETKDISRSGAIINFIKEGDKIRFQVNVNYAQQAGLKISSRLLKLAIISE